MIRFIIMIFTESVLWSIEMRLTWSQLSLDCWCYCTSVDLHSRFPDSRDSITSLWFFFTFFSFVLIFIRSCIHAHMRVQTLWHAILGHEKRRHHNWMTKAFDVSLLYREPVCELCGHCSVSSRPNTRDYDSLCACECECWLLMHVEECQVHLQFQNPRIHRTKNICIPVNAIEFLDFRVTYSDDIQNHFDQSSSPVLLLFTVPNTIQLVIYFFFAFSTYDCGDFISRNRIVFSDISWFHWMQFAYMTSRVEQGCFCRKSDEKRIVYERFRHKICEQPQPT